MKSEYKFGLMAFAINVVSIAYMVSNITKWTTAMIIIATAFYTVVFSSVVLLMVQTWRNRPKMKVKRYKNTTFLVEGKDFVILD